MTYFNHTYTLSKSCYYQEANLDSICSLKRFGFNSACNIAGATNMKAGKESYEFDDSKEWMLNK